MVNDLAYPDLSLSYLRVRSTFSMNAVHALYQKYKNKQEDKKIHVKELSFDQHNTPLI